jgi:hypothetical protein
LKSAGLATNQPEPENGTMDTNTLAKSIVDKATGDEMATPSTKSLAASTLGRLGGLKGGKVRADKLSADQRSEIAKKAAKARWSKAASE